LTSEVFLRMVKGLPSYEDTGAPFAAWLYRIAANLITDHYRRNKRQAVPDSQVEHVALDETDPLGRVAKAVEQETLRKALVALPADYQTLLILRFMQGLPNADVAAALGKSEGAVRVMQHRALKALAEQLGEAQKARSYLRGEKL
jgi:RNA polymerase sigma-70 factor (ECF subfamily)